MRRLILSWDFLISKKDRSLIYKALTIQVNQILIHHAKVIQADTLPIKWVVIILLEVEIPREWVTSCISCRPIISMIGRRKRQWPKWPKYLDSLQKKYLTTMSVLWWIIQIWIKVTLIKPITTVMNKKCFFSKWISISSLIKTIILMKI